MNPIQESMASDPLEQARAILLALVAKQIESNASLEHLEKQQELAKIARLLATPQPCITIHDLSHQIEIHDRCRSLTLPLEIDSILLELLDIVSLADTISAGQKKMTEIAGHFGINAEQIYNNITADTAAALLIFAVLANDTVLACHVLNAKQARDFSAANVDDIRNILSHFDVAAPSFTLEQFARNAFLDLHRLTTAIIDDLFDAYPSIMIQNKRVANKDQAPALLEKQVIALSEADKYLLTTKAYDTKPETQNGLLCNLLKHIEPTDAVKDIYLRIWEYACEEEPFESEAIAFFDTIENMSAKARLDDEAKLALKNSFYNFMSVLFGVEKIDTLKKSDLDNLPDQCPFDLIKFLYKDCMHRWGFVEEVFFPFDIPEEERIFKVIYKSVFNIPEIQMQASLDSNPDLPINFREQIKNAKLTITSISQDGVARYEGDDIMHFFLTKAEVKIPAIIQSHKNRDFVAFFDKFADEFVNFIKDCIKEKEQRACFRSKLKRSFDGSNPELNT